MKSSCGQSPAHGQAILLPHDGHSNDFHREIQVLRHLPDDEELLVVLPPKQCHIWIHYVEQLCYYLLQNTDSSHASVLPYHDAPHSVLKDRIVQGKTGLMQALHSMVDFLTVKASKVRYLLAEKCAL